MNRFLIGLVGGWMALSGPLAAQESVDEWGIGPSVDSVVSEVAPNGFDGAVLISAEGRPVFRRGYGHTDSRGGDPVTSGTPFWIASISKQFASSAILRLAERGVLSVDDSIGRFLPEAPVEKASITLHQLMTHTGGLDQRYAADGIRDRDQAVEAILRHPLIFSPGEGFRYSNDSYNLLAVIVEIAADQPYESFLREQLLVPAGLTRTGFWGPPDNPEVAEIRWPEPPDSAILQPNWGFRGGVGMFSSVEDLHRWQGALARGEVLPLERVEQLMSAYVPRGETGIGYGWFVSTDASGVRSVWTRGYESFGHGAVISTYPEMGLTVVIASSSGEGPEGPVTHVLADQLARLALERQASGT